MFTFVCILYSTGALESSMNNDTIRELLQNSRATSRTALSRPTSAASTTVNRDVQPDTQQQQAWHGETQHRQPFLPKIDPKGSLITSSASSLNMQNLNNHARGDGQSNAPGIRSAVNLSIRESVDNESHDIREPSPPLHPRPPSEGSRRTLGSRNSGKFYSSQE